MQVYKNSVKRHFTCTSALHFTVFSYTRSLTPQEFLLSLTTHHFSGAILAFYYTGYYSCHYTCIVQRRCKGDLYVVL